ncbi:MAG TPA: glutathione S-transferase family protein [Rhizomicrobium sp.]|nr:glutathione S-transferase family protein [Rhizomicrobium sp.]
MILHQMQMSGNCYKIRLAARQLGIRIALKEYPLMAGDTRKPEFLKLNPNGRVPLLEMDDGRTLAESGAILFYLTEGSHLQPTDKWARAQMLQWMFFEQYSHEPYIAVVRFLVAYANKELLEKRRPELPRLIENGYAALGVMETHLSKNEWFTGGAYSIADIALYGYTHCAREGGFELERYPHLLAWLARVASVPGHIPLSERW